MPTLTPTLRPTCRTVHFLAVLAALLAAGCTEGDPQAGDDDTLPNPDDDTSSGDDTTSPVDDDTTADDDTTVPPDDDTSGADPIEEIPGLDDGFAWLFSLDHVVQVEIALPAESASALYTDPFTFVPAGITIDGWELPQVGIRIKGKLGTYRPLSGKPSLRVSFDEYVEDQSFFGLEHLTLNNMVVDASHLKDRLSYQVFASEGVPACRTGYAWVKINGADYGLYLDVETVDEGWLEQRYVEPEGNLYDGKYVLAADWSYTLVDFNAETQDLFSLDEGEDVGHVDVHAVTDAINLHARQPTWFDGLAELVDWDEVLRMMAGEQWVGQDDGYSLNDNNFWVYFNPETTLMEMIPWDLDYSFLQDYQWGMDWRHPKGLLARWCMADDVCRAEWMTRSLALCDIVDTIDWDTEIDAVYTLIQPYVDADPRREIPLSSVGPDVSYVRSWMSGRSAEIRAFWGY